MNKPNFGITKSPRALARFLGDLVDEQTALKARIEKLETLAETPAFLVEPDAFNGNQKPKPKPKPKPKSKPKTKKGDSK